MWVSRLNRGSPSDTLSAHPRPPGVGGRHPPRAQRSAAASGKTRCPVTSAPRGRDASATDIALVAVDLDGTLLSDSKKVSIRTAKALACLPGRGVKVVIASA